MPGAWGIQEECRQNLCNFWYRYRLATFKLSMSILALWEEKYHTATVFFFLGGGLWLNCLYINIPFLFIYFYFRLWISFYIWQIILFFVLLLLSFFILLIIFWEDCWLLFYIAKYFVLLLMNYIFILYNTFSLFFRIFD